MTKLTETQTNILTAGAQRPGNIAMPLPKRLVALLQRPEGPPSPRSSLPPAG